MGELLDLNHSFRETKRRKIDREARKFEDKERRKQYRNCISKFSYVIDMVLAEYAKQILDTSKQSLPGLVSKDTLESYRTFYINTPNIDLDILERSLKIKNNKIVDHAMLDAQYRYLKTFQIDLNTPITDIYMSKEGYDFFDELSKKLGEEITLKHIISCYYIFLQKHSHVKNMPIGEIVLISEACGYNKELLLSELSDSNFVLKKDK